MTLTTFSKGHLENTMIHLVGFPGSGKYTIAQEMMQLADLSMVDNHLANNVVFSRENYRAALCVLVRYGRVDYR